MRTIVDIPEDEIKLLDLLGKKEGVSRAELVRRAVALYLKQDEDHSESDNDQEINKYYGFLKNVPEAFDGLSGVEYQEKVRGEWDQRDSQYSNWGMNESDPELYDHNEDS